MTGFDHSRPLPRLRHTEIRTPGGDITIGLKSYDNLNNPMADPDTYLRITVEHSCSQATNRTSVDLTGEEIRQVIAAIERFKDQVTVEADRADEEE